MGKLNRKPTRLKPYNYSLPGYYFLTICTFKRTDLFGMVSAGRMRLNKLGKIAKNHLELINHLYKDIELDNFVIMPNHIHLILINTRNEDDTDRSKMIVSRVIQQFKSVCTKEMRMVIGKKEIIWQKSFYDRIIRNEKELYLIRKYIEENPLKWDLEKNTPENLNL